MFITKVWLEPSHCDMYKIVCNPLRLKQQSQAVETEGLICINLLMCPLALGRHSPGSQEPNSTGHTPARCTITQLGTPADGLPPSASSESYHRYQDHHKNTRPPRHFHPLASSLHHQAFCWPGRHDLVNAHSFHQESLGLDSMYSLLRKHNTQFQTCLATHRVLMRSMSHEYCLI